MRLPGRIIAFFAAVIALLGAVLTRRYRPPSIEAATTLIAADEHFKAPRFAAIPRRLYVNPGFIPGEFAEAESYTQAEVAFISPIVGALIARQLVDISDYASPADTLHPPHYNQAVTDSYRMDPRTPPGYAHTLYVSPRPALLAMNGFEADEESEANSENAGTIDITITPGWRLPVATRELLRVVGVASPTRIESRFHASFCWRWKATRDGEVFDVGSDAYDALPQNVWSDLSPTESSRSRAAFFTGEPHLGEAYLARMKGRWEVNGIAWLAPSAKGVDCGDGSTDHRGAPPVRAREEAGGAASDSASRELEWSTVRTVLGFLMGQQRAYRWRHGTYASRIEQLAETSIPTAVEIRILFADDSGWSAIGSHPMFPGKACVTWIGRVNEVPVTAEGTRMQSIESVACDSVSFSR